MKKKILAFTVAAAILVLSACGNGGSSEKIATSKAGDVTKEELYEEMKSIAGEQTLQLLIIEKVLDDKYEVTDKEVDAEYKQTEEQLGDAFEMQLAQEGHTPESFKKLLRLNLLQEKALTDGVEVSDEEVQQRIDEMNTEVNARHILVEDEETALEAKEKIDDGADFNEVAKEYSEDPGSKEEGGELDWFTYGVMDPAFQEAAFSLELNTVSEPVQSSHGFHIIEVTDKREVADDEKVSKDEEEHIRQELSVEKADPSSIVSKVAKILEEADVKIKDKDLEAALAMFQETPEDGEDDGLDLEDIELEGEEENEADDEVNEDEDEDDEE